MYNVFDCELEFMLIDFWLLWRILYSNFMLNFFTNSLKISLRHDIAGCLVAACSKTLHTQTYYAILIWSESKYYNLRRLCQIFNWTYAVFRNLTWLPFELYPLIWLLVNETWDCLFLVKFVDLLWMFVVMVSVIRL